MIRPRLHRLFGPLSICLAMLMLASCGSKSPSVEPTTGPRTETPTAIPTPPAPATPEKPAPSADYTWIDPATLTIEGRGWSDTDRPFTRLPARAEAFAPKAVWGLNRNTAGIGIRFISDSPTLAAYWDGGKAMNHMAATGNCGLDLYRRTDDGWEFTAVGRPNDSWTERALSKDLPAEPNEYMLYLPLYHEITDLRLGIEPGRSITPAPPRPEGRNKPIVFYGTSIVQGGCASRAGMAHPEILGRWLDREVINLGFSGSGKMEPEMAQLFKELNAEIFVLDCLPNMDMEMTRTRIEPFIAVLREAHPTMPIVLVESPIPSKGGEQNIILRASFDKLIAAGDKHLYIIPADGLWAGRENPTVDGVHPTDLGFLRMAEAHEPLLRKILGE